MTDDEIAESVKIAKRILAQNKKNNHDTSINQYQECPDCGNANLQIYEQVAIGRTVSARTGKVIKNHGHLETTCWNYLCKCGWVSGIFTP